MPSRADRQPTEHRRDRERHAVDGPDETVRLVVAILGHEQRDRRRQGDRAQVPGDRAGQHEADERPERRVPEVLERPVRGDDVQPRGEEVRHQRAGARHQHRRLAPVVVDVGAEEQGRDRQEQHVGAADHRRGDDRTGLQVHPERQREPEEVVRDARDERVGDEQVEGLQRATSRGRRLTIGRSSVARRCRVGDRTTGRSPNSSLSLSWVRSD